MTDEGLRCRCGSDQCIALVEGVWSPSRRVTADEYRAAVEEVETLGWVGRMVRADETETIWVWTPAV